MGNCKITHFDPNGYLANYTCDDIPEMKANFRKVNRTDEILKSGMMDKSYKNFCEELDKMCTCKIPLICPECSKEDHEGYFCRCESRNIKLAKQLRKEKYAEVNKAEGESHRKRSKREDLINSNEYKNASEIQKTEFRIAYNLKRLLNLD